ncbi:hypothetical protein CAPTEDRAFT_224235 [Capitella teleta]|uniref:Uncharacterized protein n=1 Tax=Capitella teleta TaxID=283909 RepID=R7V8M7_CAPTE|nr:hypothetical protein CAPTEDRAFT_224235 [Capitella teleta]|eukprot:ELU12110.1 hypothetical protein CAPTEDRAFT_224235 [Capitella teleta]
MLNEVPLNMLNEVMADKKLHTPLKGDVKKRPRRGKKIKFTKFLDNMTSDDFFSLTNCEESPRKAANRVRLSQAPHNSNQFLMDDHLAANYSRLDMADFADFTGDSSPCVISDSEFSPTSQAETSEASLDYDCKPESRQSFFERDFEAVYKESQASLLEEQKREDLEESIRQLENKAELLEQLRAAIAENRALRGLQK